MPEHDVGGLFQHPAGRMKLNTDMQVVKINDYLDYLVYLRTTMGEAARNLEPFDDAYKAADWSRFEKLPLFRVANRMNAYNTYLLMEQEQP